MPNLEELFAYSREVVHPSNSPFAASEIPGWLRLERGEIHLFLTSRGQGGFGKRHYVATLRPGECFPACPFRELPGASGCEYGYLLVPRNSAVCRTVSAETFAAFARENPAGCTALIRQLVATLSFAYGGDGEAEARCADWLTLPETLREILRKTREAAERQEESRGESAAAETLRQRIRQAEQFGELRRIVRPGRETAAPNADPLLAALRVIAGKHHLSILFELPEDDSADPESRLAAFCRLNQWRTRRIRLEPGFSRLHHGALIGFHGPEARPCVVELNGEDSFWRFPGEGGTHRLTPDRESELQEVAYCFYESFPLRPLVWRDLVRFLVRGSRKFFFCIVGVGILIGLFGLVMPVATAYATGKIIPTANTGELWQLLILLLTLTFGTVILNVVPQLCLLLFGSTALERLMAALFDRVFRLPVGFFRKYSAGDLCMRMFSVLRIQELMFQVISQQFLSSIFALCSIVMLFYYSWQLTLVAVPLVLAYVFWLLILFLKLREPLRISAEKVGREAGFLKQVFEGIAKIRGAGAGERVENRFLDDFIQEKRACDRYFAGAGLMEVISVVMPAVINLVFFFLIGKVWRESLELAGFLAFLTAFASFQAAVVAIAEGIWLLASRKPEIERLKIFLESDVETPMGRPAAGKLDGSLEFSHVTFGYAPDQPPVLRDISFLVRPGEFVAIVGPSGAGKSSLVRLLLGVESPANGSILYSGQDLRELDANSVRRQLGVILQNSRIMPGSILENITTGTDCSPAEVEEAVRMAALEKDIAAMPMGIHTNIAEGLLSGGQQQRILIARALIGKPAVVIMDESTSALDNETQEAVRRNIETLNVTRIIIAHRLSTIMNADRIYVLDRGEIRESGTFRELMSRDGVFRKLAERQMLS